MKIRRLVLDERFMLGLGLADGEGIKVKIKVRKDAFDEDLSPDGKELNENNVAEYDGEKYFSSPFYFDDQRFVYGEMGTIVDKASDNIAPEEYFISIEEDPGGTGFEFVGIGLEDAEIRGNDIILTMVVDVVFYNAENYPG